MLPFNTLFRGFSTRSYLYKQSCTRRKFQRWCVFEVENAVFEPITARLSLRLLSNAFGSIATLICLNYSQTKIQLLLYIYIYIYVSRSPDSQLSDKWEILPEQIEFEEELGRGAFGVVYKATFSKSDEMEALVTETSKWPSSSRKPKAPQVVAVKVLHGKKYFNLHKGETKP